jgi:hypothetical protein
MCWRKLPGVLDRDFNDQALGEEQTGLITFEVVTREAATCRNVL